MLLDQTHTEDAAFAAAWKALETERALTERLVAVVSLPWYYARVKFTGKGTRKQAFELLDEIICGLLLVEDGLSGDQMRNLLGLQDDLGERAFETMLRPLQGNMVLGDNSYYALSDQGRIYAKAGSKYKPYRDPFEVIVDMSDSRNPKVKEVHATIGKTKVVGPEDGINIGKMQESLQKYFASIATLLPYVQAQTPNMHLPEKGFYLEQAQLENTRFETCNLWVGIFEDLETHTCFYEALLQEGLKPLPTISQVLSDPARKDLHDRIAVAVAKQCADELVQDSPPHAQVQDELWLLEKAKTLDEIPEPQLQAAVATILDERKTFSTQAFEDEIDQISKACKGELWIISPWIKPAAFEKRRIQIERLLKNGCKVFIGYSAPHERGVEMVDTALLSRLSVMQSAHPQLFVAELPQFHEKLMYADHGNGKRYEYTGSFNVLSFAIGNQNKIGRENMRRLQWGTDSQHNYDYQHAAFTAHYQTKLKRALDNFPHAIAQDRSAIAIFQKDLNRLGADFNSFFQYIGGKNEVEFAHQVNLLGERLETAKKDWIGLKIQEDMQAFSKIASLAPASAKDAVKKAADRIAEIGLTPALLANELNALKSLCETKAFRFDLEALRKKIDSHEIQWIASDEVRYEKELGRMRQAYPLAILAELAALQAGIETQILEKSQRMALKIVDKIDLPDPSVNPKSPNAQNSHSQKSNSKNSKKKNKKR